jgi:hypothetical protein
MSQREEEFRIGVPWSNREPEVVRQSVPPLQGGWEWGDRQPGAKAPGYSSFALPGRGSRLGAARGQGASPHPQEGSRLTQEDRSAIPAEVGRSSGSSPGRGWTGSREDLGQSAFAGEGQLREI